MKKKKSHEFKDILITKFDIKYGEVLAGWEISLLCVEGNSKEGAVRLGLIVPFSAIEGTLVCIPLPEWDRWLKQVKKAGKKIEKVLKKS